VVEMWGALLMREDAEVGFGYDAGKLCRPGRLRCTRFIPCLFCQLPYWAGALIVRNGICVVQGQVNIRP
jgi:hypothetical protein